MTGFLARRERFDRVGSTNDVVRDWLDAGVPEVCLAVAGEQTAGRGRSGRTWQAPPGRALLLSLGFRPTWLPPDRAWRLTAITSLAMAEAAERAARLAPGTVRLKWPNDLVVERDQGGLPKLGGMLGETQGLGTDDPRMVVGIGVNTSWPRTEFPADLAPSMTSLDDLTDGRPGDGVRLLDDFVARLERAVGDLRGGRFDAATWSDRQATTGRLIRLERPDGAEAVQAVGVDPETGALLVADPQATTGVRQVLVGEITHVRVTPALPVGV